MLGADWLLSYEAEKSFGFRLKQKNRTDYSLFGDLIDNGVEFYDSNAVPVVFEETDNIETVSQALEDSVGLYEDDDIAEEFYED